jgi:hypothetical protein
MPVTWIRNAFAALSLCLAATALACEYPDEGNMPLRRALTRVQMLPEIEHWERGQREAGELVRYELSLEETITKGRQCYWTVRVVSGGKVWRRFFVTPDGKSLLSETGHPLRPAAR